MDEVEGRYVQWGWRVGVCLWDGGMSRGVGYTMGPGIPTPLLVLTPSGLNFDKRTSNYTIDFHKLT